jgi:hypothetical protein
MIQFKNKSVHGQREGTCSQTLIDRVYNHAHGFTEKYRAARQVKYQLMGGGPWKLSLQALLDADIQSYLDAPVKHQQGPWKGTLKDSALEELESSREEGAVTMSQGGDGTLDLLPQPRGKRDGTGKTCKELPWIWWTTLIATIGAKLQHNKDDHLLHMEWAKSRAQASRAMEEVLLLHEEMH